MSNLILRDNGTEFFNLQTYSTFVMTDHGQVTNYYSNETILTVPRIPTGATPFIVIVPNVIGASGYTNAVQVSLAAFSRLGYNTEIILPDKVKVIYSPVYPLQQGPNLKYIIGYYK